VTLSHLIRELEQPPSAVDGDERKLRALSVLNALASAASKRAPSVSSSKGELQPWARKLGGEYLANKVRNVLTYTMPTEFHDAANKALAVRLLGVLQITSAWKDALSIIKLEPKWVVLQDDNKQYRRTARLLNDRIIAPRKPLEGFISKYPAYLAHKSKENGKQLIRIANNLFEVSGSCVNKSSPLGGGDQKSAGDGTCVIATIYEDAYDQGLKPRQRAANALQQSRMDAPWSIDKKLLALTHDHEPLVRQAALKALDAFGGDPGTSDTPDPDPGQCVYSDTKGRHCNCADGDPENHCTDHHHEYLCDLLQCKEYDKKTWLKTGELDAGAREFARRKLRNINIVTEVATNLAEELSQKQGSLDREMSAENVQAVTVLANNIRAFRTGALFVERSWFANDKFSSQLVLYLAFAVAVALIIVLIAVLAWGYYALYRIGQSRHLWDFNAKLFRNLSWRDHGRYSTAVLPETHQFYTRVQTLFEEYGGENCAAQTGRRLTSVELIRNWDLVNDFEGCLQRWGDLRKNDRDFVKSREEATRDSRKNLDAQKGEVITRMKL
jgi:hypothetical protein